MSMRGPCMAALMVWDGWRCICEQVANLRLKFKALAVGAGADGARWSSGSTYDQRNTGSESSNQAVSSGGVGHGQIANGGHVQNNNSSTASSALLASCTQCKLLFREVEDIENRYGLQVCLFCACVHARVGGCDGVRETRTLLYRVPEAGDSYQCCVWK